MWLPIIKQIENLSGKSYKGNEREMRIIADHIKAAVFIMADGIVPSNTEQGYVLRRLIRRAIRYAKNLGIPQEADVTTPLVEEILKIYDDYDILQNNKQKIIDELNKEEDKFELTLEKGLRIFNKHSDKNIDGKTAFLLFQSYGFPIEMTEELAKEKGIEIDKEAFNKELQKHQHLSRTASAGKFKSGLADNSEQTTKLHTACHLLNQALREVLNNKDIFQKGSNITPERLRFDFNFDRKLTDEEKKAIEDLVNKKIKENIPIELEELTLDEAKQKGAHGVFDSKYGDKVKVYSIGNFSKEICAGPHIKNTSELGTFKIKKEQSSSSGVRRIKAILE
jgi:alanyl-tRNA synthetase